MYWKVWDLNVPSPSGVLLRDRYLGQLGDRTGRMTVLLFLLNMMLIYQCVMGITTWMC